MEENVNTIFAETRWYFVKGYKSLVDELRYISQPYSIITLTIL
jgi:hypothetical protein